MGVFYHLRYPILGLDFGARKVRKLMVFQTMTMPGDDVAEPPENFGLEERHRMLEPGWPSMAFIEHRLASDPTNWWAANHACVEALLRSTGLKVRCRIQVETYLCEPGGVGREDIRGHLEDEFSAATGRTAHLA
jgi:tRNA (mo5U34)-methyltransferase